MHEDGKGTLSPAVSRAGASHTREVDPLTVTQRLQREGRWYGQIERERNEMMKLARKQGMTKIAAQAWVYGELDRLYPPEGDPVPKTTLSPDLDPQNDNVAGQRADSGPRRPSGVVAGPAGERFPAGRRSPGSRRTGFGWWRNAQGLRPGCGWTRRFPLPPHGLRWAGLRPAYAAMRSTWMSQPRSEALRMARLL